jgi:hypothetical protein
MQNRKTKAKLSEQKECLYFLINSLIILFTILLHTKMAEVLSENVVYFNEKDQLMKIKAQNSKWGTFGSPG